jgi:hypothetical protein
VKTHFKRPRCVPPDSAGQPGYPRSPLLRIYRTSQSILHVSCKGSILRTIAQWRVFAMPPNSRPAPVFTDPVLRLQQSIAKVEPGSPISTIRSPLNVLGGFVHFNGVDAVTSRRLARWIHTRPSCSTSWSITLDISVSGAFAPGRTLNWLKASLLNR